jgi:hypothetical protein
MLKLLRYTPKDSAITRGIIIIDDARFCDSLELPWKDNKNSISCIPEGIYKYKPHRWSRNNMKVIKLINVPNRDGILVHVANKVTELKGCIALGTVSSNGLVNSTSAVTKFIKAIPEEGTIEIVRV